MKKFKWIVEFTVDQTWIEDGFQITNNKALGMLENCLPFARGDEFAAKVLEAPDSKLIRKIQGYGK